MCVSIWIPKIIIFPFAPDEKLIISDVSKFMCLKLRKLKSIKIISNFPLKSLPVERNACQNIIMRTEASSLMKQREKLKLQKGRTSQCPWQARFRLWKRQIRHRHLLAIKCQPLGVHASPYKNMCGHAAESHYKNTVLEANSVNLRI